MFKRFAVVVFMLGLLGLGTNSPIGARQGHRPVNGVLWVANRGTNEIRGFDAATGVLVHTVPMAAGSQPGDLAYARGKVYVAEEFGTPPAIAVVDAETGVILNRIQLAPGSRPHHVHTSPGGTFVAVGLFGTDLVAVIDTHDDTLLGPWDSNPDTTNGRIHAAVFARDGGTLYLASDATGEVMAMDPLTGLVWWRMPVPAAHELAPTNDGKRAFVSRRSANRVALIDLEAQTFQDVLTLGLPDTLQLSANEKVLTVGLRTTPAQLAVVHVDKDAGTYSPVLVDLSPGGGATTLAGHQWTSPSGQYTFAAYEGGSSQGVAVIEHWTGNSLVQTLPFAGRPHGVDKGK